jgi:hypothetical protein
MTSMTTFDSREQAYEAKFRNDQETLFRIHNRRNKLLGLWAAELVGRSDADAYAKEVVLSDFEKPGDDDVLQKVLGDLAAAKVPVSAEELRRKMDELLRVAHDQIVDKGA